MTAQVEQAAEEVRCREAALTRQEADLADTEVKLREAQAELQKQLKTISAKHLEAQRLEVCV